MILNDKKIIQLGQEGMITPFEPRQIKAIENSKIASYGTSSFGYDIRLGDEFKVFTKSLEPLDIKNPDSLTTENYRDNYFDIPANDMVLCRSVETFDIPKNIMCIAVGKSTYARVGIIANITPLEAGWRGQLVIELSNTTKRQVRVYANEGIAQLLFFSSVEDCQVSYADRDGKYQDQMGITVAKV